MTCLSIRRWDMQEIIAVDWNDTPCTSLVVLHADAICYLPHPTSAMDHANPILLLLIQVAIIVTLSRFMGTVLGSPRQPQVVGEMVAGIMLGPSLFGLLYPAAQGWLFPKQSVE